jgi:aspartyl-tRNA(Asn)/glutamyl-tRNA(Gln) amidotransferase subunit B
VQGYEVVIGFETHAQLATKSKIFSRAPTAFGAEPNTQACAVDLALPGTLPVMNREAVAHAIRLGLALGSHIAEQSVFARKNYFYPDLPKGYQISQFEIPVVQGGEVSFFLGDEKKTVRLVRAHLEEDAGKSLHEDFIGQSGIDLNRAGTPLLEIVTEPDIRSSAEAVAYAKELHKIVTWIGICDGNMQEGSFRCDANVSVRKPGAPLGTRREIKNLNSFKFMQQAIDYEVRWQIEQIEDGHAIQQATVLFDPDTGETRAMRTKEDAADYRYFPDPDLPPLVIARSWVDECQGRHARAAAPDGRAPGGRLRPARVRRHHADAEPGDGGLFRDRRQGQRPGQDGQQLDHGRGVAPPEQRREGHRAGARQRRARWPRCSSASPTARSRTTPPSRCLDALWAGEGQDVDAIIEAKGLKQMNDSGALEKIIDEVMAANAPMVEQYRAGKDKAFNALVGLVMKASKGKANPQQVNGELLKQKLQLISGRCPPFATRAGAAWPALRRSAR